MAKIEISRRTNLVPDGRHQLRIWVSKTTANIPPEIFVYQLVPPVPFIDDPHNKFVHIATYEAMLTLPINEPVEDESPFFRLSSIDLTFTSLAVLERKFIRMRRHIQTLIEDIVRLNALPPVEIVIIDLETPERC